MGFACYLVKQSFTWQDKSDSVLYLSLPQSDSAALPLRRTWLDSSVATGPLNASPHQPQPSLPLNGFQIQTTLKSLKQTSKPIKWLRKGLEIHWTGFLWHSLSTQLIFRRISGSEDINFSAAQPQLFSLPVFTVYADTHHTVFLNNRLLPNPQFSHIPTKDLLKCRLLVWRGLAKQIYSFWSVSQTVFCAFEAQGLQAIWFCSVLLKMLRLLSTEATFCRLRPHQQLCYDKQGDEKGKNIKHTAESEAKGETANKNRSAWFVFTEGSANLRVKEDRKKKGKGREQDWAESWGNTAENCLHCLKWNYRIPRRVKANRLHVKNSLHDFSNLFKHLVQNKSSVTFNHVVDSSV